MTDERVSEISVPAESKYASIARNFVAEVAAEAGWIEPNRLDDLRLAVSETVTNAISAQAAARHDDRVQVRCCVDSDRLDVWVSDRAGGFDAPHEAPPFPEPDPTRERGFGLALIGALVDEASFGSDDGGTEVHLVVRRREAR